jgi:hypothetical protein
MTAPQWTAEPGGLVTDEPDVCVCPSCQDDADDRQREDWMADYERQIALDNCHGLLKKLVQDREYHYVSVLGDMLDTHQLGMVADEKLFALVHEIEQYLRRQKAVR